MKINFDKVINDANHIFHWANLESEDRNRLRGIIDVLISCRTKSDQLEQAEQAEKALTYYAEEPYLESIGYSTQAIEALKAIRGN